MSRTIQKLCLALGLAAVVGWTFGQAAPPEKKKAKPTAAKAKQPVATQSASAAVVSGKLSAGELAKVVDRDVQSKLVAEKVEPSPRSDDAEFIRRTYLDLIGVIPPAEKVASFLDSKDTDKRAKLIDELLANPRFGTYLSEVWSGMLLPRESNNRRLDHQPLQQWLAAKFNSNMPMDKLVYDLLTATGDQKDNGAVTYFIANPAVDKITDNVTQMFLGVRLQCAQCHNHPFVDIKQNEYWGMAQFFMKVRLTANPNQAAKKGISPGIFEAVQAKKGKKGVLPESAKVVPARFLKGEEPKLNVKDPYRPVVAKWITSPTNPYFAKAMVNRVWSQFFGRGIVNPIDDMHEANVPSHPELLETLTAQFKASGFDLKYLYRAICNSETYQRTSRPVGDNKGDTEYYSHAAVRSLSPEQFYDSLIAVLGQPAKTPKGAKAPKNGPRGPRDAFLTFFRIEEGANPLEYQAGIPQALRLMNSPQTSGTAAINRLMKDGKSPAQTIEQLYLSTLSRRPSAQELQRMTAHVSGQGDLRSGYGDVLWALINSSEFALNH